MIAAAKLNGPLVEVRDRSGTVFDTFGIVTRLNKGEILKISFPEALW